MKKLILFSVILCVLGSCNFQPINHYNCSDEQAKIANAFALPYWNKVQQVIDSATVDFANDSTVAKNDYKKLEQKYKQIFHSVFGQDTSVYLLNFWITFPQNSNPKTRSGGGYFIQNASYNDKKSATMYSPLEINSKSGAKFQVYPITRTYEKYTYQVVRFTTDRSDFNTPITTLDFNIEIRVPYSVEIKCLNSL